MNIHVYEGIEKPHREPLSELDDFLSQTRKGRQYLLDENSEIYVSKSEVRNSVLSKAVQHSFVQRVFYEEHFEGGPVLKLRVQLNGLIGFWLSFLFTYLIARAFRKMTVGLHYLRVDVHVTYFRDHFSTCEMQYVEDLEDVLELDVEGEDSLYRTLLELEQEREPAEPVEETELEDLDEEE